MVGRAMCLGEDLGRRSVYPLGDSLDMAENGQGAKSSVKVLRLVTTSAEGCELLRRLEEDPVTSNVPIIILTH